MLTDKLKTLTQHNHQQLEKKLVQQMKAMRGITDYVHLLQLFYTYFAALEDQMQPYLTEQLLPDYTKRRKAAALAQDIADMGGTVHQKAGADSLPDIGNMFHAFGALYVIEGSTLGGQIICRMLQKQLDVPEGKGFCFFNSYGEQTPAMWSNFKAILNTHIINVAEQQQVVDAANQTFIKFGQWLYKYDTVNPIH